MVCMKMRDKHSFNFLFGFSILKIMLQIVIHLIFSTIKATTIVHYVYFFLSPRKSFGIKTALTNWMNNSSKFHIIGDNSTSLFLLMLWG